MQEKMKSGNVFKISMALVFVIFKYFTILLKSDRKVFNYTLTFIIPRLLVLMKHLVDNYYETCIVES